MAAEAQQRGPAPLRQAVQELTTQVTELEHALRVEAHGRRAAEDRAAVAEQSAREAWTFARTIMRTGERA